MIIDANKKNLVQNYQYKDVFPFAWKRPQESKRTSNVISTSRELIPIVLLTNEYNSLNLNLNTHIMTLELQVKEESRLPCNKQKMSVINNPRWIIPTVQPSPMNCLVDVVPITDDETPCTCGVSISVANGLTFDLT
jgi:hypothetical protein